VTVQEEKQHRWFCARHQFAEDLLEFWQDDFSLKQQQERAVRVQHEKQNDEVVEGAGEFGRCAHYGLAARGKDFPDVPEPLSHL
jgi:hypothetical protein